jgi:hypothetical protein
VNNNLFNLSLLKKFAGDKEFRLTVSKLEFINKHIQMVENGDFKSEVSSYLYFYDFLKKILNYNREENILFDEKQDIGRGKSEFALKYDDKKFMVIELKDQNTDLDKSQSRVNDKRTPVDQAFDYAQHSGDINWIMVSNFKEFRLYNWKKKSNKFICFNYEDLLDKDLFSYFMVAFSSKSHIKKEYPKKLLKDTLIIEKKLESNFYKLYHETRLMLIKELEHYNNLSREQSVHYAQLILNRYMFISFSEDTGLLDSQISADTISTPIKKGNLRHQSIWQRLNELFLDINDGNQFKNISAYNGGIFQENLEFIKIRDTIEDQEIFKDTWQDWKFEEYTKSIEHLTKPHSDIINPIYKNLLTISSFDFSSQLDVNILGHIFENSIGDLEELKQDTKGRRKKEGIFYTPNYITDYICKNTIIPYLSKTGKADNIPDLLKEYSRSNEIEDLDEKLKNIKIIDPACGSGAFLNKATDILLEIHQAIFNIKKGYTTTTDMRIGKGKRRRTESVQHADLEAWFDPIEKRREILLNNIYGVDLNEESVEITKLSLFLKVCKKNLKLPNLNKNIQNGNSLIDDPKYTDKPFNWEEEFSEVFKEGGFDICIGNPPYVRMEGIKDIKQFLMNNYTIYQARADLYVYFFEKGLKLLKQGGIFSVISSDKFTRAAYGKGLRELILNYEFQKYIELKGKGIFTDATVDPCIVVIKNTNPSNQNRIMVNDDYDLPQSYFHLNNWNFENPIILDLKAKIDKKGIKIQEWEDLEIYLGIRTGYNKAFIIDETKKKEFELKNIK